MTKIANLNFKYDYSPLVLWQYSDATRLKQIIEYEQKFLDIAVTQFRDEFDNDIFNIDTCDSNGLELWGKLLQVERPYISGAYFNDEQYRLLLKSKLYLITWNGSSYGLINLIHNLFPDMLFSLEDCPVTEKRSDYIMENPQNIQLLLSNGILTLKAGSKLYMPNGAGVFDEITITEDKTMVGSSTDAAIRLLYYDVDNDRLQLFVSSDSGTTTPSGSGNVMFYNTNTNTINLYVNGVMRSQKYCFPIALIRADGTNIAGNIQQVFQGIGYIGSNVFVLPGVKILIPNGVNEDSSLNNIEYTVNSVITNSRNLTQNSVKVWLDNTGVVSFSNGWQYNSTDNVIELITDPTTTASMANIANVDLSGGHITGFSLSDRVLSIDYMTVNINFISGYTADEEAILRMGYLDTDTGIYVYTFLPRPAGVQYNISFSSDWARTLGFAETVTENDYTGMTETTNMDDTDEPNASAGVFYK